MVRNNFEYNHSLEGIYYCNLVEFQGIEIGYSSNGFWTVKKGKAFAELKPETRKDLILWLPILEGNYNFLKDVLHTSINMSEQDKEGFIKTFPIEDLIWTAITSKSEYWLNLALVWIGNLNNAHLFKEELGELISEKAISQRLRHKVMKLYNRGRC